LIQGNLQEKNVKKINSISINLARVKILYINFIKLIEILEDKFLRNLLKLNVKIFNLKRTYKNIYDQSISIIVGYKNYYSYR